MEVFDDGSGPALYICGGFDAVEGVPAYNLARWDGRRWTGLGQSTSGQPIHYLAGSTASARSELFLTGRFYHIGPTRVRGVARWRCVCPDLDADGHVGQADLGILLADWGCPGAGCTGDIDGDGDTDQGDLGLLLAGWWQTCGK